MSTRPANGNSRRSLVDPIASPYRFARMRVGLFGGSFDPAHSGHRHVADVARKRLGLHQIWWIPTAQHRFKIARQDFGNRTDSVRRAAPGPSARISTIEAQRRIAASIDLINLLTSRLPATRFVWLIGEDILNQLHRWKNWTHLVNSIPIAVIARPTATPRTRLSCFAQRYGDVRCSEYCAAALALASPPAWVRLSARHDHTASRHMIPGRTWRTPGRYAMVNDREHTHHAHIVDTGRQKRKLSTH